MTTPTDHLIKLHTALIDTQQGYEQSSREVTDSKVASLFRSMIALREKDHTELHQALVAAGAKPDDSGSFMSTVQRVVVDIRAKITGLDESTLSSYIRGEEQIIGYYDDALKEAKGHPLTVEILARQKHTLQQQIENMKAMQTA
jgi:uncharacterized protein (TIGR02284 family)